MRNQHELKLIFLVLFMSAVGWGASQPSSIFHAFNMRYDEIRRLLPQLAKTGYSHIQISPAQQSRLTVPHSHKGSRDPKELWWLRYQPVDFLKLENYQGNKSDLQNLISEAKKNKISVIADVVFNHVAALDGLEREEWAAAANKCNASKDCVDYLKHLSGLAIYKNFSMAQCFDDGLKNSFLAGNPEAYKKCMADYTTFVDCKQRDRSKKESVYNCWMDGALPDLNSTENVYKVNTQHMKLLLDMGVTGFRFDAVKNIDPLFLNRYVNYLKDPKQNPYYYFEFVGDNIDQNTEMAKIAPITDFVFFHKLIGVFQFNGNLASLRNIGYNANDYIVFTENHDTDANRRDPTKGIPAQIKDLVDMQLATTYILAKAGSVPLILNTIAYSPGVPAGVLFRSLMNKNSPGKSYKYPEYIYDLPGIDSKNVMVMVRNDGEGIYVLNKSASPVNINMNELKNKFNGAKMEYYNLKEEAVSKEVKINRPAPGAGDIMVVPGRSALFLVRSDLL